MVVGGGGGGGGQGGEGGLRTCAAWTWRRFAKVSSCVLRLFVACSISLISLSEYD